MNAHPSVRTLPSLARRLIVVGVASLSLTSTLRAQQSPANTDSTANNDTTRVYRLEGLVVVGHDEAVQTSSFLQRALDVQAAGANALETLNRAPGFNFTSGDAQGFYEYAQNVQMRLFTGQQIAITVDDIPLGSQDPAGGTPAGRIVENESVSQVTVHQGSGDIDTESSSGLGGAIVYNTSAPRPTPGGEARFVGGAFGTKRGYVRYDSGELTDGLTSYVSVSENVFDKWRGKGDEKRLHVESKLRQELPRGSVSINAYYNNRHDHDFLDITAADFAADGRDLGLSKDFVVLPDKAAQADANSYFYDAWSNRRDDLLLGVNLDTRPSDRVNLKITPYFQNQGGVGTWLPDYRPDATTADPLDPANRDQTLNTWRETQYFLTRFGASASTSVSLSGSNTLTFGAWVEHDKRTAKRVWFDLPDNNSYDVGTIRDQVTPYWTQFDRNYQTSVFSGFVKGQFRLMDRLAVTGGLRAQGYSMTFFDDLQAERRSFDDSEAFLPQLGIVFDAASEHQIFASVSRNFSQVPDDAIRQDAPVSGEKSVNVDFGYRFLRPGRTTSIAGYYVRYTDKIEAIQLGPFDRYANESALQNVGGIHGVGLELTGDYSLGGGFGLFASFDLTHSTYDGDVVDASEDGGILRIDGNSAVFVPELQTFGELSYRQGDVTLALNAKYVGKRPSSLSGPAGGDASAQEELDAYTLVGFSARYQLQRVALSLDGTNLTDTSYLASTSGIGPGTSRHPGGGTYFPGSPRWITLGVEIPFR